MPPFNEVGVYCFAHVGPSVGLSVGIPNLVRITWHGIELGSPNLAQTFITGWPWSLVYTGKTNQTLSGWYFDTQLTYLARNSRRQSSRAVNDPCCFSDQSTEGQGHKLTFNLLIQSIEGQCQTLSNHRIQLFGKFGTNTHLWVLMIPINLQINPKKVKVKPCSWIENNFSWLLWWNVIIMPPPTKWGNIALQMSVDPLVGRLYLVRMITRHRIDLVLSNLAHRYVLECR